MKKSIWKALCLATIVGLFVAGCGGGGGTPKSTLSGSAAVDGNPLSGKNVSVSYFDDSGTLKGIRLEKTVKTGRDGSFSLDLKPDDLKKISGPLVVTIGDGTSNGPLLRSIVENPASLKAGNGSVSIPVNSLTTVASSVLEKEVSENAGSNYNWSNILAAVDSSLPQVYGDWRSSSDGNVFDHNVLASLGGDVSLVADLATYLAEDLQDGVVDGQNGGAPIDLGDLSTVIPGGLSDVYVLTVATADSAIGSDGVDSTVITARLLDGLNQPVAGKDLSFQVSSGGSLDNANGVTDANGEASVTLTSTSPGTVTVTASFDLPNGQVLNVSLDVVVNDCQAVGGLQVHSDKSSIIDNGTDSAQITADVLAVCAGSTVPDGTEVAFSITGGTGVLSSAVAQTSNGQATVSLSGDTVSTITVEASVETFTDTVDVDVISDPCAVGSVALSLDPATITTAEQAVASAQVEPADPVLCQGGVPDGTVVDFAVTGAASLSSTSASLINGVAEVDVLPSSSGTASVTASVSGKTSSADVTIIDQPTTSIVEVKFPVGTSFAGANISIDYDETILGNASYDQAGTLTDGWLGQPVDDGSVFSLGVVSASAVQVSSGDVVLKIDFDVLGGTPSQNDFVVTNVEVFDENGVNIGLTQSDVTLTVVNQ